MNSAPWWLVLVAAALTGAFTLAGSWLTSHSARKRQRDELSHERTLEQEKRLHERRLELYAGLMLQIDRIMEGLWTYYHGRYSDVPAAEDVLQSQLDDVESGFEEMQRALHQVLVVSGQAVRAMVDQFLREAAREFARLTNGNPPRSGLTGTEAAFAANHLIWEMRIEVGVTSRDDETEYELSERY